MTSILEHQIRPAPPADVEGADALLVSVVIPCLNEEETIGRCVRAAREVLADLDGEGEVIVVDNDSEDESGRLGTAWEKRGQSPVSKNIVRSTAMMRIELPSSR